VFRARYIILQLTVLLLPKAKGDLRQDESQLWSVKVENITLRLNKPTLSAKFGRSQRYQYADKKNLSIWIPLYWFQTEKISLGHSYDQYLSI